jgi:single-stranded DNA-specific DHH superfamily exonuclease
MDSIDLVKRKIDTFLEVSPGKKIAIISDNDEDGLTAAVQATLFFEAAGVETEVFFYDHTLRQASFFGDFNRNTFDATVFLD